MHLGGHKSVHDDRGQGKGGPWAGRTERAYSSDLPHFLGKFIGLLIKDTQKLYSRFLLLYNLLFYFEIINNFLGS